MLITLIHDFFTVLVAFISLWQGLFFIRALLSFFPNIQWWKPPFTWIRQLTDPLMLWVRSFVPPFGMLDLSIMVIIIGLNLLKGVVIPLLEGLLIGRSF
ncbi:MAG: YggT family protein [Vampirovibrionales bacterium]